MLADPHPEVQSALHLIAGRIAEITEVHEALSLVQLLAECAGSCPDLVLLDPDLVRPAHSQALADAIKVLRRLCPASRVVVMSSRFEAEQAAVAAGADGFISKTAPPDEFLAGLTRFLANRS